MFQISQVDAAYIAGLFEGEACFDLVHGKNPRIRIQMTDKDVIERVQRICGGSEITESSFNKQKNPNWKLCWGIHITKREEVEGILTAILPFMGERRSQKIHELLNACKTLSSLTEYEKKQLRAMCDREKKVCEPECFIGSCGLLASSAFLIGGLGHSGFRKRWTSEVRMEKAEYAKLYARAYAATLA